MLQLTINGLPAVPKEGSSFKLTRENPYFSTSGDYTLEVTLPLAGCTENLRILGAVHRPEASKAHLPALRLPFRLLAPPELDVEGTAIVTTVTETEAKVQLLAGRSELKIRSTDELGRDLYVDRLDLGHAWDTDFARCCPGKEYGAEGLMKWFWGWEGYGGDVYLYTDHYLDGRSTMQGKGDGRADLCDCALLPAIYTDTADENETGHSTVLYNNFRTLYLLYRTTATGTATGFLPMNLPGSSGLSYMVAPGNSAYQDWLEVNWNTICNGSGMDWFSPQPRLYLIVERVLRSLGFEVDPAEDILRNDPYMRRIIIASPRQRLDYAGQLPHWTVATFIEEVEKLLSVRILPCGEGRARIVTRASLSGKVQQAHDVADEVEAEIDADQQETDPTRGNLRYKFHGEYPSPLALKESVYEEVDKRIYASPEERDRDFAATPQNERRAIYYHLPADDGLCCHVWKDPADAGSTVAVAPYGPLYRDPLNTDDIVELRIVPANGFMPEPNFMGSGKWSDELQPGQDFVALRFDNDEQIYTPAEGSPSYYPQYLIHNTQTAGDFERARAFNAYSAIFNPDSAASSHEEAESEETMEVAFTGCSFRQSFYLPEGGRVLTTNHAVGMGYRTDPDTGQPVAQPASYFSGVPGGVNVFTLTVNTLTGKDTWLYQSAFMPETDYTVTRKVQYTVRLADRIQDPTGILLIRGRRYAVAKIEYTIDADGLQPQKTAYLYEIG